MVVLFVVRCRWFACHVVLCVVVLGVIPRRWLALVYCCELFVGALAEWLLELLEPLDRLKLMVA